MERALIIEHSACDTTTVKYLKGEAAQMRFYLEPHKIVDDVERGWGVVWGGSLFCG